MDRGCLLAVQGEGVCGEDYQVFVSDGRALGQVLVLGRGDPAAGGKLRRPAAGIYFTRDSMPSTFSLKSYLFLFPTYATITEASVCAKVCAACRFEFQAAPGVAMCSSGKLGIFFFLFSSEPKTFILLCLPSSGLLVFALCSIYLKQTIGKLCCLS